MGSPAEKPDPPKTKEEAGQLAVDARYHDLEKIAGPQQRAKAESLIRSGAEKDSAAIGNAVERARASQAQWEQKRESLSEKTRSGSPGSASARPSSGFRMRKSGAWC